MQDVAKSKKRESAAVPVATKAATTPTPHYKLNTRPVAKFKPISLSSPSRYRDKSQLFEGLEGHPVGSGAGGGSVAGGSGGGGETFVPRKSIKKLTIRPKPSEVCAVYSTAILSSLIDIPKYFTAIQRS